MATNRKFSKGKYSDVEQVRYEFDYLYDYLNGQVGADGFGKKGKRAFEATLLKEIKRLRDENGINTPKIGIYLHGFNNDWQESIDELVDLHKSLTDVVGYEPILVGFSWPSLGKKLKYLSDREQVRDSVPAFTRFLQDIHEFLLERERDCICTTYCIAHSLGNYLLRKSMEYLSDHLGTPVGRAMFNETVMLAPDLSSKDIELDGKGSYIGDFSRRVHVYYSRHDRALKLSSRKRFGANRLGRHGAEDYQNVASHIVFVNAEEYAESEAMNKANITDRRGDSVSVHSSHRYHPKILADVASVLSSIDRDQITTREADRILPPDSPNRENHYRLI